MYWHGTNLGNNPKWCVPNSLGKWRSMARGLDAALEVMTILTVEIEIQNGNLSE